MASSAVVGILKAMLTADTAQFDAGMRKAADTSKRVSAGISGVGTEAAKTTPQLERMVKAFSGDKLLYSANNLTGAITKIGGATKLTEAEQARANRTLSDAIAKYAALGKNAPAAMVALEQATRKVEAPTNALTTKMVALGAAVGSFIGNIAANAVQRFGQYALEAAANGAKLTAIAGGFNLLATSIGQSGQAMLTVTRTATKGLISDLDLMQSMNKAILLGLPVTAKEMGTLAKAAISLGRAMGLDATSSLNDLITALGRSSPMILDNLGLTVKVGEANEAYARSLGKTSGELTDAEKKLAFYNAAMEAAQKKTAALGEVQLTAFDNLKRLGTGIANVVTETIAGANESEGFAGALKMVADKAAEAAQNLKDLREARRNLGDESGGLFSLNRSPIALFEEAVRIQTARSAAVAQSGAPGLPQPAAAVAPTASIMELIESQEKANELATKAAAAIAKQRAEVERFKEAMAELDSVTGDWISTLATLDGEVVEAIKFYLQAGVAQNALAEAYGLTATQIKAVATATQFETAMAKSAFDTRERWNDEIVKSREAQLDRVNAAVRASFGRDIAAQREGVHVSEQLDIQRTQFSIDLAKLTGASWQRVGALEATLAKQRFDVALAETHRLFEERMKVLDVSIPAEAREYDRLAVLHAQSIDQMTEDFQQGEILKRLELRKTHDAWVRLWARMKADLAAIKDLAIGNLGDLLFNFGHDPYGDLRKSADDAKAAYDKLAGSTGKADAELQHLKATGKLTAEQFMRLKKEGKTSAEELERAFQDWREAEDRANYTFGERFKDLWINIKRSVQDVLNDLLKFFVENFIKGLINGIASAKLGEKLGAQFASAIPGGGGGGGGNGVVSGLIQKGISKLFGFGGGASAFSVGTAGTATTLASASIPTSMAMTAVPATVTAGTASAGGAAAGGAGGAGAGSFLTNPAFWTNPWTIAGMGAIALSLAVWKKGLFRGGWEAVEGNKRRDKFIAQWGDPSNKGVGGGGHNLAAKLVEMTGGAPGEQMYRNLQSGDKKKFESAEDSIISLFASKGITNIKKFMFGGFVPPGVTQPAILHGGSMGEIVTPVSKLFGAGSARVVHNHYWTVQAWDGADVKRVFREEIVPLFKSATELNTDDLAGHLNRVLA